MAYKVWKSEEKNAPVVLIHCFTGDGAAVWQACREMGCKDFNLVAIFDLNLDDALTPWTAEGVRNGQSPFGGKASLHLENILNKTLPLIDIQYDNNNIILVGYSLAGLFSLWAATQTDCFHRIGCVSASFWYPDFLNFMQQTPLSPRVSHVYFSLGDKESKTRHPLMSQNETLTNSMVQCVAQQKVATTFEMNPGNHFTEPNVRTAKAIKWLLEQ